MQSTEAKRVEKEDQYLYLSPTLLCEASIYRGN